jgi:hypothetical protein
VQLKKTKSVRAIQNLGQYYMVDVNRKEITIFGIDIAELGRELKVLAEREELVESEGWRRKRKGMAQSRAWC